MRYSGAHLCTAHFAEFFERRVKREIRGQIGLAGPTKIAVGVSGGKDSVVLLHLLHRTLGLDGRVSLVAVTVDEGIETYRPAGVAVAKRACQRLGIEHRIVRFEDEFNVTLDGLVEADPQAVPCAKCGILRRQALNDAAREMGADYVATGHNLDDVAQSILMNYVRGDLEAMTRLGPHDKRVPGLVPRVMPLRLIPEREVALYAHTSGIEFDLHDCPNATFATRGKYRDILLGLEEDHPGARHALVAGFDRIVPILRRAQDVPDSSKPCAICGKPASGRVCRACEIVGLATATRAAR